MSEHYADGDRLHLTCQNCGKHQSLPVQALQPSDRILCLLCGYTLAVVKAALEPAAVVA